ncbi:MAG: hypothetical protein DMF17_10200 [Verrucomicrobia bacterium]|nr:MAG: hypothetical protein DMF17_10200 [Verrucomicrobiota bacterium]
MPASNFSNRSQATSAQTFKKQCVAYATCLSLSGPIPPNYEIAFQEITSCALLILIGMSALWI